MVTVDENAAKLTVEVCRLALGTWFLNHFKEAAMDANAYISSMFYSKMFESPPMTGSSRFSVCRALAWVRSPSRPSWGWAICELGI